jgi:flagellar basal body-associated protein FliL
MQSQQIPYRSRAVVPLLIILTILTLTAGCGGAAVLRPRPEQLVEVPLGAFRVPLVPKSHRQSAEGLTDRNGLLLRFHLCAVVSPEREGAVLQRIQSHEVRMRDDIITACRSASLDELSEPSLGALKSRLTKAVARHFDHNYVRRVVVSNILFEPI